MKRSGSIKRLFTAAVTAILSFTVLFAAAWIYLSVGAPTEGSAVDTSESSVPYEQREPNRGVMFAFPSGSGCLFYLDFEYGSITAVLTENYDPYQTVYGGYSVDFTVNADMPLLESLIDRVGGVELEIEGERLRYTGVQITELLSVNREMELRREIVSKVLAGIAQNGFTASDFVYIIENSETSLTVPDCYGWHEEMAEMCARATVFYLT